MVHVIVGRKLTVMGLPQEAVKQIRKELTLPNPEYQAAVRRGYTPHWLPETVTLFERAQEAVTLPRGYLDRLTALVQCQVQDERLKLPQITLGFHGALRAYQERACVQMARYGSGILVAPPGSGKTCMGMWFLAHWKQPALLLCHTLDLERQLAENARQWLHVEPGFIGDGTWNIGEAVTVALVQSLTAKSEATEGLARRVGLVLLDEAHHAPADTFMDVLQRFPAAVRYGLTATPHRRDGLGLFMEAVIGPVRSQVTHDDLRQAGLLVRPRLEWIRTGFRFNYVDESDYQRMLTALVADAARNGLILEAVGREMKAGRRCLVLTERVAHAATLARALTDRFPDKAVSITGNDGKKHREAALSNLRNGILLCVVATKLADEGLDLPELERLFLVTPARAQSRVMQRLGRLMRPAPGKALPVVYDFVDPVPVLEGQAKARWYGCYRGLVEGALPEWLQRKAG